MRPRALLLLALFLGAGTSLPSLDAVVYHRHGPDRLAGETHWDPAGGCGGHADHCTLSRTPPGSRSIHLWAVAIPLALGTLHSPTRAAASRAIVPLRGTHPQPRAPPAPAA
jgi:hypothetical protein